MIVRQVFEGVLRRCQLFFYLYVIIQTKLSGLHLHHWAKVFLQFFLTVSLSLIQIGLLLILELFRQLVRLLLYMTIRDFDGLLNGQDSVWAKVSEAESKCTPAVLAMIEHESPRELQEELRWVYQRKFAERLYERAYSKIDSSCGFYYYLKTRRINVEDHVVPLSFYDSEDSFEGALGRVVNEEFPEENRAMWRVYVGHQPMNWLGKSSGSVKIYPVLYRMHHSMGDGIALLNLFVDMFVDDGNAIIKDIYHDMNSKIIRSSSDKKAGSSFGRFKGLLRKIPSLRYKDLKIRPSHGEYFLRRKKLSGKKLVSFLSEERPNLVEKVRQLKRRLDVSFTDVVNAAISASFADFIKKTTPDQIPETLSATMVVMLGAMDLAKEVSTVKGRLKVKLHNKFTSGNVQFEVRKFLDGRGGPFKAHIMDINRQSTALKNSIDLAYNEWQLQIPTPSCITRYILNCSLGALLISSLPGCGRLKVLNGRDVHDMAFWVPNMLRSGIGVSVQTYDNRFQIGLLVDEALIQARDDLKGILKGVFEYLGLFYGQVIGEEESPLT